jgi:hypothetical protein
MGSVPNAIAHTPDGGRPMLSVNDRSVGIPQGQREAVVRPFLRVGLGLPVAIGIVEARGGTVAVRVPSARRPSASPRLLGATSADRPAPSSLFPGSVSTSAALATSPFLSSRIRPRCVPTRLSA